MRTSHPPMVAEKSLNKILALCALLVMVAACRARLEPPPVVPAPALVPQPLEMTAGAGRFAFAPGMQFLSVGLEAPANDRQEADRLQGGFREWLGAMGWRTAGVMEPMGEGPRPAVVFSIAPGETERLGAEGYALTIAQDKVVLRAARPAGLFYGMQTLRQLVMARSNGPSPAVAPLSLPCFGIVDKPRYAWRGFMLDCCRHFFTKEFIKKCLDEMALFKLNRFHWHLTDDQAWRLAIKQFPELAEKGGTPTGGYYTQEDVREIVAYAAARFITVVPEIEMPGHATAALTAYPDLSCTGGPFATMAQWGVFADVYCAGNEKVFAFLEDVLDEVVELFPGPWVHVGGDECPKTRWQACPKCQARMQAAGLKDEAELQSWFIRRIEKHLKVRGKRLIGWDEILEGGLAPDATVMSWRGMAGGMAAARQQHDVVMAPTQFAYLDYCQGDPRYEPPAIGGFLPLKTVYAFEPTPPELDAPAAAHILGGQANLWTEYIATPEHASTMMWPRLAALAEVVWSAPARRGWDSFLLRLGRLRPGMESMAMNVAGTTWRPVISARALSASGSWQVEMTADLPGATIRYALGRDPGFRSRKYRGPFAIKKGGAIRAALFQGREQLAPAVELRLWHHMARFAAVRVSSGGKLRPEANGEALLVDGLQGSLQHKDGAWLGVEGGDLEAVIDLGRSANVGRIAARFLEHPAAWIFPPTGVEAAVSLDGREWTAAAQLEWPAAGDFTVLRSRDADLRFAPRRARYVRLVARGLGACPPGHSGAGGKAWIFTDEIVVE